MTRTLTILALSMALLLTACKAVVLPPVPVSDDASIKLAEAATSIDSSMLELEAIRKSQVPKYKKRLPDPATYCMTNIASVDWTGPIGPLVDRLAAASGYRVRVLGKPPAIPVLVNVTARDIPLAEILRDADFQAAAKAQIVVYASRKTIELRYK
ncbi:type IVB secretion system lipoprotein DotD [soil metagenome]